MTAVRLVNPSGSLGSIQFNNLSEFDGDSNFVFDIATQRVGIGTSAPTALLHVAGVAKISEVSGSLTTLVDGQPYLNAGSNITLSTGSNGSITIAGEGGSGTIGDAEDDSYEDGLFTDFTTETPVGTAIDRFNEILKLLVPTPAPDLDDVDINSDGIDVKLSFGVSNDQSSADPAYINVTTTAGHIAVDVNGDYITAIAGNNLRAAAYDGATDLVGDLNEDIPANITTPSNRTNYPVNSFGDADIGSLVLEVNGANLYTLDLTAVGTGTGNPGSGTGNHVNGNGSGFINVSIAKSGTFDSGSAFDQFKHRTGQWKIDANDQRIGWNYLRIKHVKDGVTVNTNYVEWVNDPDNNALSAGSTSLVFAGAGSLQISGVTYYTSGTGRYRVTISNAYRYVYDTTANSFVTSNAGSTSGVSYNIENVAKPAIGGGENHLKQITIDETDNVTANYILGGSLTGGVSVSHPIKNNLVNAGQATASGILTYNVSDTATVTSETFQREAHRLQSNNYTNQSDVTGGALNWSSAQSLVGASAGHNTGLQVYRERLYAPKNTLNSGDFRNSGDGGSLANGPDGNPNYSAAGGVRVYFRKFQNTGAAKRDLSYTIQGSATLVGSGDAISNDNKFRLFFKMPSDGAGNSTGWLDAKAAFTYNNVADNNGAAIGAVDTSTSMTNNITLGTVEVGTNEYVVAKIEADDDWTGYLDTFSVTFGAVGAVNSAPVVNDVDCNQSGVNGKLSFGSNLAKAGYTNVSTTAGFAAVNANGAYNLAADRRGIFNGAQVISGDINESTAASGNSYPANAFGGGSAHLGSLKLEVNGAVIHTADLTSAGAGSSLTNGSGFINLTAAAPGQDGSNLPDYTKFYRTGQFQVATAAQRNGWNYVRVIHTVAATDHASDYVEWANDGSNPNISFASVSVGNFASGGTYQCSGVTYFITPTGRFDFTVSNLYKYVYSSSASGISFPTTTNCTVTSIAATGDGVTNATTGAAVAPLPALDTNVADSYDDDLVVQATFSFDQATSLPGETAYAVTLAGRVNHPLEGNTTTSSTSSTELLVANFTDNSTNTAEYFNGEVKRLKAGTTSYTTQAHISGGSNNWNSATSMDGADAAHNTGLIVYDGKLRSPQKVGPSGNLGDFRDSGQSGTIIAPNGNPDYGSLTNATREYVRWFKNTSGASKTNFDLTINGTGTIVQNTEALGSSNKIQVFAKISHSSADQTTGWMDTAKAFASGQNGDNAGALVGSFDSSLNATNEVTFGTKFVDNNEYILIKIVADKTWTGNITQMSVSWS